MELKFKIPGPDESGYLRRERKRLEFIQAMTEGRGLAAIDELIEFLSEFVIEPKDPDAKVEALYDASQDEIMGLLKAIGAAGDVDPTKDAS